MNLKDMLKNSYTFIVVPKAVLDTPIEMKKMLKEDGSYYTLHELEKELDSLFELTDAVDERFVKFRWSIPLNGEEALIIGYLKSKGLVDMRDNGVSDSLNYTVDEIDFTNLNGNEFGIFNAYEIKQLPEIHEEETIMI